MTPIDWREALSLRIDAAGLNPRAVSLAAGLGPTALRDILSGRSQQPRRRTLMQIGQVLGCTVEEILNPPEDLDRIIAEQNFGHLLPPSQATADSRGKRPSGDAGGEVHRSDPYLVPILDPNTIADATPPEQWSSDELALPWTMLDSLQAQRPAIVKVADDAMSPTLNRGDWILIDRAISQPRRDGVYVLQAPARLMIRRLLLDPRADTVTILADNPNYHLTNQTSITDIHVFGLALWRGHAL